MLAAIADCVRARAGFLIVDEIYQGLTYDHAPSTGLALGEDVLALASFSKYFSMTGWRLGWLVAPRRRGNYDHRGGDHYRRYSA